MNNEPETPAQTFLACLFFAIFLGVFAVLIGMIAAGAEAEGAAVDTAVEEVAE